ncbi:hypothetical protein ACIGEP_14665 [Microbacterium sp. NPDC077663]
MPSHRSFVIITAAAAALTVALAGCTPNTTRSIAVRADQVVAIEYFE